jgi:hypothetical protein
MHLFRGRCSLPLLVVVGFVVCGRMVKTKDLPPELDYLMSDAIRDVTQAREFIVVYPNEIKKTALKGRVVLPDGTINAPEFSAL